MKGLTPRVSTYVQRLTFVPMLMSSPLDCFISDCFISGFGLFFLSNFFRLHMH